MIAFGTAVVFALVDNKNGFEVQLTDDLRDEAGEVILTKPVMQGRR